MLKKLWTRLFGDTSKPEPVRLTLGDCEALVVQAVRQVYDSEDLPVDLSSSLSSMPYIERTLIIHACEDLMRVEITCAQENRFTTLMDIAQYLHDSQ